MIPVIFDLDGTLIDSAPDIQAGVNRMLADQGRAPLDLKTVTGFVGDGLPKLVERTMRHVGMDLSDHAEMTRSTQAHYAAHASVDTRIYPGVEQALKTLANRGHALGLCTNKPYDPTVKVLQALKLDGYFDAVVGGDSLPVRKPDPAPLIAVAKQLKAECYIFVGDSPVDAETAERAGAPFLLFTKGYRRIPVTDLYHTDTFDHHDQLVQCVAKLV